MRISSLRRFVILAESGSLYQAARRSDVTPQAYSKLIDSLEREIGHQLVLRENRGVRLTPAGEIFLDYAKQTVNGLHDTVMLIEDKLDPASDKTRTITMFHTHWSMEIISLYDYLSEGLGRLELRECPFDSMVKRLEHPEPDFAFGGEVHSSETASTLGERGIVFEPFYETVVGVVVSKGSKLAQKRALDMSDLTDISLAHYTHREWNRKVSELLGSSDAPKIRFESTAYNMLLQYALDDASHGFLTDSLKFYGLQRSGYDVGRLSFVPLSGSQAIFGGGIFYSKKHPPSLRVRSMYDKFRSYAMDKIPEYYSAFPMLRAKKTR